MGWTDEYEKHRGEKWEKTKLSPEEEERFRHWLSSTQWFKDIHEKVKAHEGDIPAAVLLADMTGDKSDYDYRGAWMSGIEAKTYQHDGQMHWPSRTPDGRMLKSPNHPTAWMEFFMQQHGIDPNEIGIHDYESAKKWEQEGAKMPLPIRVYGKDGMGAKQ